MNRIVTVPGAAALCLLAVLGVPSPPVAAGELATAAPPPGGMAVSAPAHEDIETNLCTDHLLMDDPQKSPGWNGWGNGPENTRYQPQSRGKLTAHDLPRLELKWAFGYANVSSGSPQPTVLGGRVFAPSENGHLYALDARTGCRYWTYEARAGIPTAVVAGPYHDAAGNSGLALFFGDRKANAYAVDAQSGREIWVRKVAAHAAAAITGGLAFDGSRVFVPMEGASEAQKRGTAGYPCCTFRGSLSALDASTGVVLWKTHTMDASSPRPPSQDGTPAFGPAGAGIASTPTIDKKRRLIYVATGNGSAGPPQLTTNAVLALDINTGEVKWSQQVTPDDHTDPADLDLSAPPALVRVNDRDLLVLSQKSGIAWALDPNDSGAVVWQYRIEQGSSPGGQWGVAVEDDQMLVGLRALHVADGKLLWDHRGQGGLPTAIPGAVLNGSLDGGLRAYDIQDGSILWTFDTHKDFDTVNGVKAHGGGMDSAGPVVAEGMLFVTPGNVLLALGLPERQKAKSTNCSPFCKN